jgi:hypothetical protein
LVTFEEQILFFYINQKSNFRLLGKRDGFSIRHKCVFDPSLHDDGWRITRYLSQNMKEFWERGGFDFVSKIT